MAGSRKEGSLRGVLVGVGSTECWLCPLDGLLGAVAMCWAEKVWCSRALPVGGGVASNWMKPSWPPFLLRPPQFRRML